MAHCGILNVNKPSGRTSRRVVDQIEQLCRPEKVGHAGTLDPLATGVLVVCVGQATRLVQYIQRMRKQYRATFLLGARSNTDDTEGEITVVPTGPRPDLVAIESALPHFLGEIQQRPPSHSAIKIGGRRAYALARKGTLFELSPRTVTIHQLSVRQYEYPQLELDIQCGSGTYVRSLGRDIAAYLGTAAVMSALERLAVGSYCVDDAVAPNELTVESLERHLHPLLEAVADMPRITLHRQQMANIRHGRPIEKREVGCEAARASHAGEWAAVDVDGRLAAIVFEKRPNQLWPRMNLV